MSLKYEPSSQPLQKNEPLLSSSRSFALEPWPGADTPLVETSEVGHALNVCYGTDQPFWTHLDECRGFLVSNVGFMGTWSKVGLVKGGTGQRWDWSK